MGMASSSGTASIDCSLFVGSSLFRVGRIMRLRGSLAPCWARHAAAGVSMAPGPGSAPGTGFGARDLVRRPHDAHSHPASRNVSSKGRRPASAPMRAR